MWIVFACEMFFRIFNPWPILPRYVQSGDFGIRVNMPNEQYVHKTKDYRIDIRTNDKGLRADASIPYEKPSDVKRVVVLGDSFGMGYGVNLEDTFTELLRGKLEAKTGHKYEIINLSVSGFGTAEQLLMLQQEGIKYSPDIVLSEWHHTDLSENTRSRLYKVENGELIRDQASYLPGVKQREFLYQFSAFKFIAENSHLYNWARERAASKVKKVLSLMAKLRKNENDQAINESTEKEHDSKHLLTLLLLEKIKNTAESIGAQHVILNVPKRISRIEFKDTLPTEFKGPFSVVNPIASFKQHPNRIIYWENSHGHFTPFGCMLVAQQIVDSVI